MDWEDYLIILNQSYIETKKMNFYNVLGEKMRRICRNKQYICKNKLGFYENILDHRTL